MSTPSKSTYNANVRMAKVVEGKTKVKYEVGLNGVEREALVERIGFHEQLGAIYHCVSKYGNRLRLSTSEIKEFIN